MRYSEVIGSGFYHIRLTPEQYRCVDAFYLSASHHRIRSFKARDPEVKRFHLDLYLSHVRAFLEIIALGDFSGVFNYHEITKRGLHRAEGWSPEVCLPVSFSPKDAVEIDRLLPDPDIFSQMIYPDRRFLEGENHPYDVLLTENILVSDIALDFAHA